MRSAWAAAAMMGDRSGGSLMSVVYPDGPPERRYTELDPEGIGPCVSFTEGSNSESVRFHGRFPSGFAP
jgi:hypothetical protein